MGEAAVSVFWNVLLFCPFYGGHSPTGPGTSAGENSALRSDLLVTSYSAVHNRRLGSATFERMGVARLTIALATTLVAMSAIQKLVTDLRATGRFETLQATLRYADADLFQTKG